jgi:putative DNA modification/repair radical SAM protein
MEDMVRVARTLRETHLFRGYIHLKTIPGASGDLIAEAGLYADRLSMNIELPSERSLQTFAPEKSVTTIKQGMAHSRAQIEEAAEPTRRARKKKFAPAGQSTQMIVGADGANDAAIIGASANLYASYALKRVYYSAFSPNGHPSATLPHTATPLLREHRLYQSDWLLRFYGFDLGEVEDAMEDGMLDLSLDPKLAWALKNRADFPVDVNTAPRERLLRVPGLGTRSVDKIIASRRSGRLRLDDVAKLAKSVRRVRNFLVTADWRPRELETAGLKGRLVKQPEQLALF